MPLAGEFEVAPDGADMEFEWRLTRIAGDKPIELEAGHRFQLAYLDTVPSAMRGDVATEVARQVGLEATMQGLILMGIPADKASQMASEAWAFTISHSCPACAAAAKSTDG